MMLLRNDVSLWLMWKHHIISNEAIIEKSKGGWDFEKTGTGKYNVNENVMYLQIPLGALGLDGKQEVHFNFKLSDNKQTDGDILNFYQSGDVAPG